MKKSLGLVLVLLVSTLMACQPTPVPTIEPTPTPIPVTAPAYETAAAFLGAWGDGDYRTMYALCSRAARASISYDEFLRVYQEVADESTALAIHPSLQAVLQEHTQAYAAFTLDIETSFVGDFQVENELPLVWEGNRWTVEWSKRCILRELGDDNLVHMDSRSPVRANIYDVNGKGLAFEGDRVTVGVVPGAIENEPRALATLSQVLKLSQAEIKAEYEDQPKNWFIPIADISIEESRKHYTLLSQEPGISLREKPIRVYREPSTAPHIIGYMAKIPSEELAEWQAVGYTGDELVGRTGIEAWGEPFLAGQRGGALTVITPEGQVVATLARRDAIPARSVYLTFDYEFQRKVEDLLGERKGAVVVMDVSDGRVLAMATWPRFEPQLFDEGIDPKAWSALVNDPGKPLVNRAMQGQYPPGSTFKIVTMGTIMERGGVEPTQTYSCPGSWSRLGWPMTCWLKSGHGTLDLVTALTASCDVTFYQIGYDLAYIDRDALPSYARSFGLGTATGIGARFIPQEETRLPYEGGLWTDWDPLGEVGGLVPDDAWKRRVLDEGWSVGDNVNLSIGQGFLLVTPLQMGRMVAAVANGGSLYRPQLVLKISGTDAEPEIGFEPERVGRLPVTAETLQSIRKGLEDVTTSRRGTAWHRFVDFPYHVAGKTGTAQNEGELPHAWFVGYLPADAPEIAIVAMVENSGEGSTFAAPLFRQVAAAYYGIEEEAPEAETQTETETETETEGEGN
jgi:penicillin-binding protein 2